ncbi:MAG TPA: tol-pal system protein YbgF [Stellaceae bacterium]|nr:tol-pal system protein YbgF [Stellaceae bacterium]
MLRRQLLPCAWLTIALGVATLTAVAPAWGQDLTTEDRLDRLERDLNMLQRQVYGGAPPPPGSVAAPGTGATVDLEVRMERLEQQMRDLTGRVEELGNRVDQLHQRIEQINSDVDMRLGLAPGAAAAAAPPGSPPAAPPFAQPYAAGPPPAPAPFPPAGPGGTLMPPAAAATPPAGASGGPTPIFGTLNPPGTAPPQQPQPPQPPPRAVAAVASPAHPPALPAGTPEAQFDYAFKLVRKAAYPAAETALRTFVERHPQDRLAGSAQYWLGETYYERGRYLEAAAAFAEGYKRWPKSSKAADDLLKLGMALARASQKQNACLAFSQLDHDFPHPGTAVQERVVAERRRLGC